MGNEEFFDKLKPWSKRKHRLLGKYLKPFIAKVASTTSNREIYCIDAFAGTAKYEDGSAGSPLLMAQLSDECAKWKNPVTLKIINVESNTKNYESLKDTMKNQEERGIVTNINSSFDKVIPEILQQIGNAPALFFIDPFGSTSVYFSHLLPILERNQKITELITNFDTDGLYRIACASISEKTTPKTAKTNAQSVIDIVGSNKWQSKFTSQKISTKQGENILLEEYSSNLNKFGYNVVRYPIREALDTKPKYHFVYCTRHSDGIDLMNDFVREEDDLLYGEYIESDLPLFQEEVSVAEEEISRRKKLYPIMKDFLEKQKKVTRKQVIRNLVSEHFGYFHSKDYRAVFKEFMNSGELKTSDNKTKIDNRIYNYFPKS